MEFDKGTSNLQSGFTLLEVIIALAIFSIGILGTVAMQLNVVAGNARGNIVSQELLLAQWVLEQKKNGSDPVTINDNVPNLVDPGPYDIDISITNPLGSNSSRFITVTVSQPGRKGAHPVTVKSLTMGNGI
ncbi:MAG: prepilin-type N-terminal cleavage/methylation domain-containing protein [Desulfobulbaceae bacterium]|nr:prepilin-type N-terminal cleavage/methylation domain-containing protein [Desulfobulbaceae bacterium]